MENRIKIIEQFSIWFVDLEKKPVGHEQGGERPFFVISSIEYNIKAETPIGFIVSTSEKKAKNPYTIPIDKADSHVNVSQIRTLDISRFKKKIQNVEKETALKVIEKFLSRLVCSDICKMDEIIKALTIK